MAKPRPQTENMPTDTSIAPACLLLMASPRSQSMYPFDLDSEELQHTPPPAAYRETEAAWRDLLAVRALTKTNDWPTDRKSTRLNSSHLVISYAVFCLKKK